MHHIMNWLVPSAKVTREQPGVTPRPAKKGVNDVPGPLSFPIFGASWIYSRFGPYENKKFHKSNEHKLKKYGPVVREGVTFNYPLIHLFDKDDIDKVLRYPSEYPLRPPNMADAYYRRYRREFYLNDGIVNLNGPEWHRLRMQLTPPLTNRNTPKRYATHMNVIADDFKKLVASRADANGGVVQDFKELVYLAGLETVSDVALEKRMGFLDEKMSDDTKLILESIRGYQTSSNESMYGLPWYQLVPKCFSGVFTNLVKHKDNLFVTIGKVVDETLEANRMAQDLGFEDDDEEDQSILNLLLRNEDVHIKDVKASVVDYITAGVETIGNSIIFAMALIAKYPDVQKKLQEELDHFVPNGGDLTIENIQEMRYLRACVQESFRMVPTACQIARILEEETEVSGNIVLPKGHVVLCHTMVASLQEENFTRAKEFLPERWLDNDPETARKFPKCERGLVVPFGVGKRACPGKRLAEQEVYIMVGKLFQEFDVELEDKFSTEFNFLLAPSEMRIKVTPRR